MATTPTYKGTDHTRELVPLLAWSPSMAAPGADLGLRSTCSDLGATILDNFNVAGNGEGAASWSSFSRTHSWVGAINDAHERATAHPSAIVGGRECAAYYYVPL